jgi:hypothetical protein
MKSGIKRAIISPQDFEHASCEWAELLLGHGAEMHAKTRRASDAVDLAIEARIRNIAELLIQYVSNPTRFGDLSGYR